MKRLIIAVGAVATLFFATFGMGAAEAAYPAADNLRVASQQCNTDGSVTMTIAWNSYNSGVQRLDVSAFSNAFQPGTYMSYGDLPSAQSSSAVSGLRPGIPYYVRVNTMTSAGWVSTPTSVFSTTGCAPFVPVFTAPYVQPYVQPYVPVNAIYGNTIGSWINGHYYTQVVSAVNTPLGIRYVYTPVVR